MSTTTADRVPALKNRNTHPADELPAPPAAKSADVAPPPGPEARPEPAVLPAEARTTTTGPTGDYGPADTYGIVYPGDGTASHNARIKTVTKDRLEAALDTLRQRAREAGGDRKNVSLGSITDRAIEEFLDRRGL